MFHSVTLKCISFSVYELFAVHCSFLKIRTVSCKLLNLFTGDVIGRTVHTVNKYLLSNFSVSGIILETRKIKITKTSLRQGPDNLVAKIISE